jgi:SWI/SNF-related matrix-associated actin-dependent regulator 1 of chromatin subfamily A
MTVALTFESPLFVCRTNFQDRHVPKEAGFRFVKERRCWTTYNPAVAARLRAYADQVTRDEIDKVLITVSPWSKPLQLPRDLELKPFQPKACKFALERNKSYLALDPGLGKTVVAAVVAATLKTWCVVYICPQFLTLNTEEEFKKWAPGLQTAVVSAKTDLTDKRYFSDAQVLIVSDSVMTRPKVVEVVERHVCSHRRAVLFIDEAQRFKTKAAKRSKALYGSGYGSFTRKYGLTSIFDKTVLLSGTPMPNRPIELFHTLSRVAPETIEFMTEQAFGEKYCAGFRSAYGWDFSGASNMKELAKRVKHPTGPFMYRLRKDKLDLPPKTEELLFVGEDMPPSLAGISRQILRKYSPADLMKQVIAGQLGVFETALPMATYRRMLALHKVGFTAEYVSDILDTTNASVLLFGIHKEAIAELVKKLYDYDPIVITGDVPTAKRHALVKAFQTSKHLRLFIGNIQAAGVGLTLTKARRVIMHEDMWTPGENKQAGDRAHRIGQTEPVLVQHVVHRNSLDAAVMQELLRKSETMRHI